MNKLLIMVKGVIMTMSMIGFAHAENSWTGFYAGANAGFAFNNAELTSQQLGFTNPSETCNTSSNFSTFFPGVQAGYLYQFPNNFVSGIEANVTVNTNQTDTLNCRSNINPDVYDGFTFRNQMQGSIRGRIGNVWNWNNNTFLPYLTAGASFANVGLTYQNEGGDYYANNTIQAGWLLGAGIEWAFMQHWSLRAEYYYVNYGETINLKLPSIYDLRDPNGSARVDLTSSNIVVALNYWI